MQRFRYATMPVSDLAGSPKLFSPMNEGIVLFLDINDVAPTAPGCPCTACAGGSGSSHTASKNPFFPTFL